MNQSSGRKVKLNDMKACIGLISWFPGKEPERSQRINRLNQTFKQLNDIFGDIYFIIVAQNWKDYKVPEFIKNTYIYRYDKLGILGARKKLRENFLKSSFDYLIMADDDIILKVSEGYSGEKFLKDLEKYPQGFGFIRYGWALTFCAISRWIYEKQEMMDVDPEKEEGYEDTTFPNLLHYRFPDKEFKITKIDFLQHKAEYHKNHKSTWASSGHNKHDKLKFLTDFYVERFKQGNFIINDDVKREALDKWNSRQKTELEEWIDNFEKKDYEKEIKKQSEKNSLPSLNEWLDIYY